MSYEVIKEEVFTIPMDSIAGVEYARYLIAELEKNGNLVNFESEPVTRKMIVRARYTFGVNGFRK